MSRLLNSPNVPRRLSKSKRGSSHGSLEILQDADIRRLDIPNDHPNDHESRWHDAFHIPMQDDYVRWKLGDFKVDTEAGNSVLFDSEMTVQTGLLKDCYSGEMGDSCADMSLAESVQVDDLVFDSAIAQLNKVPLGTFLTETIDETGYRVKEEIERVVNRAVRRVGSGKSTFPWNNTRQGSSSPTETKISYKISKAADGSLVLVRSKSG